VHYSGTDPVRKPRATKRHRQARRWIIVVSVALIIVTLLTVVYFWCPVINKAPVDNEANPANSDKAFTAFTNQYLDIMKSLNSSQTKAEMTPLLNPSYNQTDLFSWEQSKLTFASNPSGSFVDPIQILNSGEGICLQWSIVCVSACLALGYQSRLVVAVDTEIWSYIHVWAEDYHGTWVPVGPSDKAWNDPHTYLSWSWGQYIGSTVKIYAFEDNKYEDVTSTYGANSS
jgi:transglutaminase-like putative cysteine protease